MDSWIPVFGTLADAVVVNDVTRAQLQSLKTDRSGEYIGDGPFGALGRLCWQLPVIPTPSLDRGEALVGSFRLGARLHDRMTPEVLVSSEDRDKFIKNMLTTRVEQRVTLAVRVPDAFVYVDELGVGFTG
jgi:HK97 family phage major capsid protein